MVDWIMRFEAHCRRCHDLLGDPFPEVNRWIDQLAWKGEIFDPGHRKYRHHFFGVEWVREMWGDKAASAAALHILDDLYGPVPHSAKHEIPLNMQDYLRRGWH
jgi:hypothetical protein